jgi:hypothetical protein
MPTSQVNHDELGQRLTSYRRAESMAAVSASHADLVKRFLHFELPHPDFFYGPLLLAQNYCRHSTTWPQLILRACRILLARVCAENSFILSPYLQQARARPTMSVQRDLRTTTRNGSPPSSLNVL